MSSALHHLALGTRDLDATLRLYRDGLGFAETMRFEEEGRLVSLLDDGRGVCLEVFVLNPGDPPASNQTEEPNTPPLLHLAVRVPDVDAAANRCRSLGFTVPTEPTDMTLRDVRTGREATVRYAFIRGPGGEAVELLASDSL